MNTDYTKWNNFEDSDDEGCNEDTIHERNHKLLHSKRLADKQFAIAEVSKSQKEYEKVLTIYERIVLDLTNDNDKTSTDTKAACKCNIACCLIRLEKFSDALVACDELLTKCEKSMTPAQTLRICQFKCHSLLQIQGSELGTQESCAMLTSLANRMKEILRNKPDGVTKDHLLEYTSLFDRVNDFIATNTVTLADRVAAANQLLYTKQYKNAILAYTQCIALLKSHGTESSQPQPPPAVIVEELFSNLAQAYVATRQHEDAANTHMSFVDHHTATCTDTTYDHVVAASAAVKAAAIYFKLRQYEKAILAYQKAVELLEPRMTIHDATTGIVLYDLNAANSSSNSDGSSSSGEVDSDTATTLFYIAKSGAVACQVQVAQEVNNIKADLITTVGLDVVQATKYFESMACKHCEQTMKVASIHSQRLQTILHHLFVCYVTLTDCVMSHDGEGKKQQPEQWVYDFRDSVGDRVISVCNALLHVMDTQVMPAAVSPGKTTACKAAPTATVTATHSVIITLLRTKRAYAFYAKGQMYAQNPPSCPNVVVVDAAESVSIPGNSSNYSAQPTAIQQILKGLHAITISQQCTESSKHVSTSMNTAHTLIHESLFDAILSYYEHAASEFQALGDLPVALTVATGMAELWVDRTKVEPFQFDASGSVLSTSQCSADEYTVEKAHDAWRHVAKLATKCVDTCSIDNTAATQIQEKPQDLKQDVLFYRQQAMLALFNAGLCAMHYNNSHAQRAFESAQSTRDEINKHYNNNNDGSSGNDTAVISEKSEPVEYHTTCGDMSYHLGQVYLRGGKISYAIQEAKYALYCYHYLDQPDGSDAVSVPVFGTDSNNSDDKTEGEQAMVDRTRVRQTYGLLAVAYSICEKIDECEEVLAHVKSQCIGPIEDGTHEVETIRRLIESKKPKLRKDIPVAQTIKTVATSRDSYLAAAMVDDMREERLAEAAAAAQGKREDGDDGDCDGTAVSTLRSIESFEGSGKITVSSRFQALLKSLLKPLFSRIAALFSNRSRSGNLQDSGATNDEVDYVSMLQSAVIGVVLGVLLGVGIKLYQTYTSS